VIVVFGGGTSWDMRGVESAGRSGAFEPDQSRESVLWCITYPSEHSDPEYACVAHSSAHGDEYWAVACNVYTIANRKPAMFCPNMFGFWWRGGGEDGYKFLREGGPAAPELLKNHIKPLLSGTCEE